MAQKPNWMHWIVDGMSIVALVGAAFFYMQTQKSLAGYVTKDQFDAWRNDHKAYGDEVISGLRKDYGVMNDRLAAVEKLSRETHDTVIRINAKLDTALKQQAAVYER